MVTAVSVAKCLRFTAKAHNFETPQRSSDHFGEAERSAGSLSPAVVTVSCEKRWSTQFDHCNIHFFVITALHT